MTPDERIEFLIRSAESHDRALGEITERIGEISAQMATATAEWNDRFDKLLGLVERDSENIRALVHVAEIHHARLNNLEGRH